MSNGIVHDKFTVQLSIPVSIIFAGIVFYLTDWLAGIIAFFMCYIGFQVQRYMTPDLDVDSGFYGFHLARINFGWLGIIWQWYWKLYAVFTPHRSKISHYPIISTLIRFFLFILPLFFLWSILYLYWDWTLYFICGMILADLGHLLLDFNLTFRKWYESL